MRMIEIVRTLLLSGSHIPGTLYLLFSFNPSNGRNEQSWLAGPSPLVFKRHYVVSITGSTRHISQSSSEVEHIAGRKSYMSYLGWCVSPGGFNLSSMREGKWLQDFCWMENWWDAAILGTMHACKVAHCFHIPCTLCIACVYVTHEPCYIHCNGDSSTWQTCHGPPFQLFPHPISPLSSK